MTVPGQAVAPFAPQEAGAQPVNPMQVPNAGMSGQPQTPAPNAGAFNVEGIEEFISDPVLAARLKADLVAKHQAAMGHNVSSLQSRLDSQNARLQQQLQAANAERDRYREGLERALVASAQTDQEAQDIELRIRQARLNEQAQQLQQQQAASSVEARKAATLQRIGAEHGINPAELAGARNRDEALELAVSLKFARQQRPMVPQHQFPGGPSGGGQPRYIPDVDSAEFDDMWDRMAGRTPRSQLSGGRRY